jgi:glycine/D-amino acid oxidase-like deaminating enzyme
MAGRVLIVGQGLAGTALGLELEARGIDFLVASDGHATAASRVAAGLVNPVTGQRWTRSAHVDELLPVAQAAYARWEQVLGVQLWHALQLTRRWRDDAERAAVAAKLARGDLAPFATTESITTDGVKIAPAAWVDLPALLTAAARRWHAAGRWRECTVRRDELGFGPAAVAWGGMSFSAVVFCVGAGRELRECFPDVPWEFAKGQMITVAGLSWSAGHAVSQGHWVLALGEGRARVGATYEREFVDGAPTTAAADLLRSAAQELTRESLRVVAQDAAVRVSVPDRLPLLGWSAREPRLGLFGGLGSKGVLWAPALAARFAAAIVSGRPGPQSGPVRWGLAEL